LSRKETSEGDVVVVRGESGELLAAMREAHGVLIVGTLALFTARAPKRAERTTDVRRLLPARLGETDSDTTSPRGSAAAGGSAARAVCGHRSTSSAESASGKTLGGVPLNRASAHDLHAPTTLRRVVSGPGRQFASAVAINQTTIASAHRSEYESVLSRSDRTTICRYLREHSHECMDRSSGIRAGKGKRVRALSVGEPTGGMIVLESVETH
jgi:hypothetical protein